MMTRNEVALERLRRHAAYVIARRERALAQPTFSHEEHLRLQRRYDQYVIRISSEIRNLDAKLANHQAALRNALRRRARAERMDNR